MNVTSAGMVTAVGLDRASSCAALRAGVDGFAETKFIGAGGDWLIGAPVPLPREWIGEKRLAHLAAGAIVDALRGQDSPGRMVLILCLAEPDRPGRPIRNVERFAAMVREHAGLSDRTRTLLVEHGRPAGFVALETARKLFAGKEADSALIVGVDTLLTTGSVLHYQANSRLLTANNSNGFIPGEAAAAILCRAGAPQHFAVGGIGMSREKAFIYNPDDMPLRGDGMTMAYKEAMEAGRTDLAQVEYRLSDLIGEQYFFKQTALAALRLERGRKRHQDLWSPTESLGNIGAAVVPLMIGWALEAFEKAYDPGSPVLIEASSDAGACGAAVLHSTSKRKAPLNG